MDRQNPPTPLPIFLLRPRFLSPTFLLRPRFRRYRETRDWTDVFKHTGRAVSITTFTNLLGFVGMALSRHQGLASMGQILVLGLSLCFVAAITVLPVLTGTPRRESK